ncbi:MAG: riboflavin synthase [Gemmatimonadota bacterium]|nr:riboflavin synthase [Gemmatimonadota bacterium]
MFTGIVSHIGEVTSREDLEGRCRFAVAASGLVPSLREGDSISCAGVCLTAVQLSETAFHVDAVETTLSRTTLRDWGVGRRINLETALAAGEPLGGHLVQGHVDGVAKVVKMEAVGDMTRLAVTLDHAVAEVTVDRGSLTIDGVSLTVADLSGDVAEFAIIPYTWSHTTLGRLEPGATVNVEADVIGKYVRRLIEPYGAR